MKRACVVLILTAILTACSADEGLEGLSDAIPEQDAALVAAGEDLYAETCASCHGEDLTGTDQGPSHLSEVYEPNHHTDLAFVQAMQFGSPAHHWAFGRMPPVEGLSEDDMRAIIAFVRENQRIRGFEPYPPR